MGLTAYGMTILYLLVPIAILLAGAGVWAFIWAVRSGQFDDVETPAIRILLDDEPARGAHRRSESAGHAVSAKNQNGV